MLSTGNLLATRVNIILTFKKVDFWLVVIFLLHKLWCFVVIL